MAKPTPKPSSKLIRLLRDPQVQRAIVWAIPFVLKFIQQRLANRKTKRK